MSGEVSHTIVDVYYRYTWSISSEDLATSKQLLTVNRFKKYTDTWRVPQVACAKRVRLEYSRSYAGE